jgi:hypothetical protein
LALLSPEDAAPANVDCVREAPNDGVNCGSEVARSAMFSKPWF